jgi:glyoxylase-like metal-dependent hydrolase (beta-lactamase superfamily II)
MLQGAGGNIGACVGEDGVFLIDDQFAPLTEKIRAAISKISKREIRFLINTHWHYDHVGGNEKLGEAGTVILAHDNVRYRLSTEQFIRFFNKKIPPYPKAALPIITFSKDLTFHLNGEEIYFFHVKHAHTDGDAVVYFKRSNVIHTGDIYFAGYYPFIDLSSGGAVDGMIEATRHILSIIDDKTKIIPGHGPMSSKADFFAYLEMLVTIRARMEKHIQSGKTLADIQALAPSKEFDSAWGDGFLSPEKFVQILYDDLSRKTNQRSF